MLPPAEVARRRELLLVDIRPASERRSELGFLPASLGVPLTGTPDEQLVELAALGHAGGVVLYCTSGRRSAAAWEALAARAPFPLFHLEGGQLAWAAAGLPVCRAPDEPVERPASVLEFRRQLVSCFVAEATEVALNHNRMHVEPFELLQTCFSVADVSWDEPTVEGLYRVVDRTGLTMYRAGGELQQIALNLGMTYAMLRALENRE